jgi:hypothetical protein
MKAILLPLMIVLVFIAPIFAAAGDIPATLRPNSLGPEENAERFKIVPAQGNMLLLCDMKEGYVWAGYLNKESGKFYFEHVTFDKRYRSAVESKRSLSKAANKAETLDLMKYIQVR